MVSPNLGVVGLDLELSGTEGLLKVMRLSLCFRVHHAESPNTVNQKRFGFEGLEIASNGEALCSLSLVWPVGMLGRAPEEPAG